MTPEKELETRKAAQSALGAVGKLTVNGLVFGILGAIAFAVLPCLCTFFMFCLHWWQGACHFLLG